jgi:hypothetical protein
MSNTPIFQRRHYEAVAKLFSDIDLPEGHDYIIYFASMFARDNPRFNASRFREACNARTDSE